MIDPRRDRIRPLGLLDLVLIVAASAVWLAVVRFYEAGANMTSIWYLGDHGLIRIYQHQGTYFLVLASFMMLVIRLRPPRPPRRRLWRQPGLAASAGTLAGIAIGVAGLLAQWSASASPTAPPIIWRFEKARPFAAPGVFGAWVALGLMGRWRPERSGIDRLGRLVGWLWLLEFLVVEMPMNRWYWIIDNLIRQRLR